MTVDHETSPTQTQQTKHKNHAPAETWNTITTKYAEHITPSEQQISALTLDLIGLRTNESFLDVAADPNNLKLATTQQNATVLATDQAPAMLTQFDSKVRSKSLTNAAAQIIDTHALKLDSNSFDVTNSQFGMMLVPNQTLTLHEWCA